MMLIPKNWKSFQHYKDRNPPWVKLHKTLLDDSDFSRLPIASKALAPMLWLLASESKDGTFDGSIEEIAFRLRWQEKDVSAGLKPLIDKGLFVVASTMLAESYQDARPEREGEREAEREKEREVEAKKTKTPEGVSDLVFKDFVKLRNGLKAPVTETALKGLQREANKAGITLQAVLELCCQNGWRGFQASWILDKQKKTSGDKNREIMSGLTRGLIGGNKDVQLLGK